MVSSLMAITNENAKTSSSQKRQLAECRIPAIEDFVNTPTTVPDHFAIGGLDIQHAMLRNELFVSGFFLPRGKFHL